MMIAFSEEGEEGAEGLFEELHEGLHGDRPRKYELVPGATNPLLA